jgi:GNAT superfamily N-acetyltransferase
VTTAREIHAGETALAGPAMLHLRPHLGDVAGFTARADAQRGSGFRLAGSFEPGVEPAAAVAGFRLGENLAWGRHLYVDDLSTAPAYRGRGHADALFAWLIAEARRLGCDELHLDSGVGPERESAHRFYFNHGLRITSYHFAAPLP